jgi:hypothetical protein
MGTRTRTLGLGLGSALTAVGLVACAGGANPTVIGSAHAGSSRSSSSASTASSVSTPSSSTLPTAASLLAQARTTVNSYRTGRMQGTLDQGSYTEKLDVQGTVNGSNEQLVITFSGNGAPVQGTITVLTVSGQHYLKGDRAYWQSVAKAKNRTLSSSQLQKFTSSWFAIPASNSLVSDLSDLTIESLTDGVIPTDASGSVTPVTTSDGHSAYHVVDPTDDIDATVLNDGKATLVSISGGDTSDSGSGSLTFSQWNAVSSFTAPPNPVTSGSSSDLGQAT